MPRCIDVDKALSFPLANGKYDHEHANEHFIYGLETYREWLEQLPTVSPDVVRGMGKWIRLDAHKWIARYKCSACNTPMYVPEYMCKPLYSFCPNCGAKMEVSEDA